MKTQNLKGRSRRIATVACVFCVCILATRVSSLPESRLRFTLGFFQLKNTGPLLKAETPIQTIQLNGQKGECTMRIRQLRKIFGAQIGRDGAEGIISGRKKLVKLKRPSPRELSARTQNGPEKKQITEKVARDLLKVVGRSTARQCVTAGRWWEVVDAHEELQHLNATVGPL